MEIISAILQIEKRNGNTLTRETIETLLGSRAVTEYHWIMEGPTGTHRIVTNAEEIDERVTAHWNMFAGTPTKDPAPFTFHKWSQVADMIKAAKQEARKELTGLTRFHYHGFVTCVNGERKGDANDRAITRTNLLREIADAERDYPGQNIEISIEGHYDWFEDHAAMFAGEYEPTETYIDVLLYKSL